MKFWLRRGRYMSRHDPKIALRQMLEHAEEAVALAQAHTRGNLDTDRLFALAITRLIEIIGEAANRVPPDLQATADTIPWAQIIATRNRLIHGYDQIDPDIVWAILTRDLPALLVDLRAMLGKALVGRAVIGIPSAKPGSG